MKNLIATFNDDNVPHNVNDPQDPPTDYDVWQLLQVVFGANRIGAVHFGPDHVEFELHSINYKGPINIALQMPNGWVLEITHNRAA